MKCHNEWLERDGSHKYSPCCLGINLWWWHKWPLQTCGWHTCGGDGVATPMCHVCQKYWLTALSVGPHLLPVRQNPKFKPSHFYMSRKTIHNFQWLGFRSHRPLVHASHILFSLALFTAQSNWLTLFCDAPIPARFPFQPFSQTRRRRYCYPLSFAFFIKIYNSFHLFLPISFFKFLLCWSQ